MTQKKKDDVLSQHKWREKIKIHENFNVHREELSTLISRFWYICDGHMGYIKGDKHRILLTDVGVRPIFCAVHRAGMKTRAVKKA